MGASKISDSVCLNHPNTPAVTRCAACGKPICENCIVSDGGSSYCSAACAKNAKASAGRIQGVNEGINRTNSARRIRNVIILIILIAIGAAGYYFYKNNKNDVDRFVQKTERKIEKTVKDKAAETKNSINQGIPTTSKYKSDRENLVK